MRAHRAIQPLGRRGTCDEHRGTWCDTQAALRGLARRPAALGERSVQSDRGFPLRDRQADYVKRQMLEEKRVPDGCVMDLPDRLHAKRPD